MIAALHLFEPAARAIAAGVVNAIWEDSLIFLVVALLLRMWRGLNAATRYAAWFIALVAAIAVPILTSLAQPSANPSLHSTTIVLRSVGPSQRVANASRTVKVGASPAKQSYVPSAPFARFAAPRIALPGSVAIAIVALWIVAVLFFAVRLLVGLAKLERLKRNALPLPVEHRDALARCTDASHGGREVRLCVSDETEVPVAVGLFDSMILIPRHLLDALSLADVEHVCLHEIAHLRRADDWTNLLQRVVTALAWFSPGIYGIARGLDLEREVACDDNVIAETGSVRPYAQCLTKMAEITAWPHSALAAPGVFVTRRGISERVERLLRAGRNVARGLAFAPTALAIALLAFLGFGMRAIAPTAAAPLEPVPVITARAAVATHPLVAQHAMTAQHAMIAQTVIVARSPRPARRNVYVHAIDVRVPGYTVAVPPVSVRVPAVNVTVPGVSVHVPQIGVHVPAMHVPMDYGCGGCDYSDVNWSGRDLHGRRFVGTDFSSAHLIRTNFSYSRIEGADFSNADLRGANFRGAYLSDCDLSNANLRGADFTGARIQHCGLEDAILDGARFDAALLNDCDLDGVDLRHVDLSTARVIHSGDGHP